MLARVSKGARLTLAAGCVFVLLAAPVQAQEHTTYVRGFAQGHVERLTTRINGLEESYDLVEPSIGASLLGSFLSPRFLTYEAGVGFLRSDLSGDAIELKSKDINYFFFGTFFPGRRFTIDLLARQYTDELKDNLFLFNRNRFREVGGKLLLYEGEKAPQIGIEYYRRNRRTMTALDTFDEAGSDLTAYLDKRNADHSYHLSFIRSAYESKDFGFDVTTNIISFNATKQLRPNLEGEIRGDLIRSTTTTSRGESISFVSVDSDEDVRGLTFLAPFKREETEIHLGTSLRYRTPRLDADADLDFTRASAGDFTHTQELGQLRAIYRPSNRTTWNANYSLLLSSTNETSDSDQLLTVRWTRRSSPTLVYYVQGEAEVARSGDGAASSSFSFGPRDFTRMDLTGGADYTRGLGRFTLLSNFVLGAGYASVSPGESGLRSLVEARVGLTGRLFRRGTISANVFYKDRNDASTFSFDTNEASAQLLFTTPIGRRLQLRALAFASRLMQEGGRRTAGPVLREQVLDIDIRQRTAELGLSYFLIRNTFGTVSVGRTSTITKNFAQEDLENRITYLDATLSSYPISNLRLTAHARIHRGFQLTDIVDDQDFIELTALYRLRDWEFLLGYTTNQIILGTTDLEQNRAYFTVRRNFSWRVR